MLPCAAAVIPESEVLIEGTTQLCKTSKLSTNAKDEDNYYISKPPSYLPKNRSWVLQTIECKNLYYWKWKGYLNTPKAMFLSILVKCQTSSIKLKLVRNEACNVAI